MTLKQQVTKMPSVVAAQPEKPSHYTYLKSFRTEQCKDFQQHRCKQHRPYTCFNWHFPNQRRRRPIRKRDGSFNYSAYIYCSQFDEAVGACPDGDSCAYLHRNFGDTERHYHLRNFKTEQCAHSLNAAGHCSKHGIHCMFAHGPEDTRKPVLDITETEPESNVGLPCGEYSTEKDEKALLLEPKWNDTQYVLAYYKTERCPKWSPAQTGRLCRLGFMCPYFHSCKDRRRSLASSKYRSIACPMVKNKDEWTDPEDCEKGDNCAYCHTRMELQYHPDVYKTLKCEAMSKNGHCVKGIFCAFSHVHEHSGSQDSLSEERSVKSVDTNSSANKPASCSSSPQIWNTSDSGHGLSDISLLSSGKGDVQHGLFSAMKSNQDLNSSIPSCSSELSKLSVTGVELSKLAPGCELSGGYLRPADLSNGFALAPGAELSTGKVASSELNESMHLGPSMYRHSALSREFWNQSNISGFKMREMAPVGFSPALGFPQIDPVERARRQQILMQQAAHIRGPGPRLHEAGMSPNKMDFDIDKERKLNASIDSGSPSRSFSSADYSPSGAMALCQMTGANGHSLLESPDDVKTPFFPHAFEHSSNYQQILVRMRMELEMAQRRLELFDEEKRQIVMARDKALEQVAQYKAESSSDSGEGRYLRCLHPLSNLDDLSVPLLQQIETQIKNDLQRVKTIILEKAGGKCLNCLEKNASLRLPICRHKVLCEICYMKTNECPSCQTAITMPQ